MTAVWNLTYTSLNLVKHILANVLVSWEGQKKQNKLFYEHLEEVRNEIQNMFLTRNKIFSS